MNKLARFRKLTAGLGLILLLGLSGSAQTKSPQYGEVSIKTSYGYLFINNTKEKSFTLEIKGKDIQILEGGSHPTFIVDDKLLQIILADTKFFVKPDEKLKEEEILEKHRVWENDYLNGQLKQKLDLKVEKVIIKDFNTLSWGYVRPSDKPKTSDEYDRDYLLTKVVGKDVLALSTSLYVGEKLADYQKFLVQTMETLKISDTPFDILKIAEAISKDAPKRN